MGIDQYSRTLVVRFDKQIGHFMVAMLPCRREEDTTARLTDHDRPLTDVEEAAMGRAMKGAFAVITPTYR